MRDQIASDAPIDDIHRVFYLAFDSTTIADGVKYNTTTKNDTATFIWKVCHIQANQAKKSGKKSCRFSPVMFRLCIELYIKNGSGRYDFLAETF